jgi:hypothetical protein
MPTQPAPDSGGFNSRADSAKHLNMSMRRLDELIKTGDICAVRDGRSVKVTTRELERYIADLPPVWANPSEVGVA